MPASRDAKRRWKAEGRCANCGSYELPDQPRRTWKLCERCLAGQRENSRRYARKLRERAFEEYGGPVCSCCGETERAFLTIDHINGGGNEHRRSIGGQSNNFYQWLKANSYPEGFQVLCQNCNVGKYRNGGVCPHREGVMPSKST